MKIVPRSEPHDIFIGRPSPYGNPFHLNPGEPRGATLDKYKAYFLGRLNTDRSFRLMILGLSDKTVACYCKPPQPCHGTVIKEWLETHAGQH